MSFTTSNSHHEPAGGSSKHGIVHRKELSYTFADGTDLILHRFEPLYTPVLYIHGGGFLSGSVERFTPDIARYAIATGLTFYAPEAPFPKPLEDLHGHAGEEGIDRRCITVMSHSVGDNLGATAALMARERDLSPGIERLVLVYPMLDDRTRIARDSPLAKHLTCAYLDGYARHGELDTKAASSMGGSRKAVSQYAAPTRVTGVSGLAKTHT
ncbi:Hormone-sensitive lipase [Madurella mycetomatis]|uniref:Hormone-sensitive lipase n=1 Tax=Madurella mycetomatis TaxID=100816 RepID=A0A175W8D0_9PEZI|nr:Hormone-sensitive lipase [Madurella mycetomatis]